MFAEGRWRGCRAVRRLSSLEPPVGGEGGGAGGEGEDEGEERGQRKGKREENVVDKEKAAPGLPSPGTVSFPRVARTGPLSLDSALARL